MQRAPQDPIHKHIQGALDFHNRKSRQRFHPEPMFALIIGRNLGRRAFIRASDLEITLPVEQDSDARVVGVRWAGHSGGRWSAGFRCWVVQHADEAPGGGTDAVHGGESVPGKAEGCVKVTEERLADFVGVLGERVVRVSVLGQPGGQLVSPVVEEIIDGDLMSRFSRC